MSKFTVQVAALLAGFASVAICFAQPADPLLTARRILDSGAPRVALDYVAHHQPRDSSSPAWGVWEGLRCGAMLQLGQRQELVSHVQAQKVVHSGCLQAGADAAVLAGAPATARGFLARILWTPGADDNAMRMARLAVIQAYAAEGKGDDAYRSMLRMQQDLGKADAAIAERFVNALMRLNMDKEAVGWLAALDDGPVRLRLRLRTGGTTADAAVAEARQAVVRTKDDRYWMVLADAGQRAGSPRVAAEAYERLLGSAQGQESDVQNLWQAYIATARDAANRQQLLAGDDAAWGDFGARQMSQDAVAGRAFFAYLVRQGATPESRRGAQLQLVHGLQSSTLGVAALRLFGDAIRANVTDIDVSARHLLSDIAESRDPAMAARLREGLAPPPGVTVEAWNLRTALGAIRAGDAAGGARRIVDWLAPIKAVDDRSADDIIQSATSLSYGGHREQAVNILLVLQQKVSAPRARRVLETLGALDADAGRHGDAARRYLEVALMPESGGITGLQARQRATASLLKAGYLTDARAQLDWLVRNAGDVAMTSWARDELSRLR